MAAAALGAMAADEVPAPLKAVARFTPAKRVRAGGAQLGAVLESDPLFRQRVADRVRVDHPELTEALARGERPPAADPLEVAALAYLLRSPGWTDVVRAAESELERSARAAQGEAQAQTVARLQEQLAALRAQARTASDRARDDLAAARTETAALRRRVREVEAQMRRAEATAAAAEQSATTVREEARAQAAAADAEQRRLRARLGDAEAALDAARRAAREGRGAADVRLRLLLDTVLEAAQGLRRELALPPVTARPADSVGGVAPPGPGVDDVGGGVSADDPAGLDRLLELPRLHLLVDGYNVTKSGYPALSLEDQRSRLLTGLAGVAARTGAEVTVVFDGAALDGPVPTVAPRGVRVLFSAPGETADDLIRRLVQAEPTGRPVVVVSSDREVADGVRRSGARPVAAATLLRRLDRG
jgi:predicted RNA-binding protein with PIN domain